MVWVIVFLLAIVGEVISGAFIAIWFAGGAVAAYIALSFDASLAIQILSFLIGTGLSMLLLKPLRDRHLKKGIIKTNIDSLLGEIAVVTEPISNVDGKGAVKLRGLVYSARSLHGETFTIGEQVVIERIEGVKFIVSKKEDTEKTEQNREEK